MIVNIVQPDTYGRYMTPISLLERFQDPYSKFRPYLYAQFSSCIFIFLVSNSVVVFFRLLASAYIRIHADDFVPFLFDPETFEPIEVIRFCESQVEATGREAGEHSHNHQNN